MIIPTSRTNVARYTFYNDQGNVILLIQRPSMVINTNLGGISILNALRCAVQTLYLTLNNWKEMDTLRRYWNRWCLLICASRYNETRVALMRRYSARWYYFRVLGGSNEHHFTVYTNPSPRMNSSIASRLSEVCAFGQRITYSALIVGTI